MKKTWYTVIMKDRSGVTAYGLNNLNQIYGLLVGRVETFQSHFVTFLDFKRWWRYRDGHEKECVIGTNDETHMVKFTVKTHY